MRGGRGLAAIIWQPASCKKRPAFQRGQTIQRFISTSTPGRRSLLISTSGSRTRRRSSIVTSGSRMPLPTVTSGERCSFRRIEARHRFGRTLPPRSQRTKEWRNLSTPPRQPERELHASRISMIFSTHINARRVLPFRGSPDISMSSRAGAYCVIEHV